jgi:hypothetical protein
MLLIISVREETVLIRVRMLPALVPSAFREFAPRAINGFEGSGIAYAVVIGCYSHDRTFIVPVKFDILLFPMAAPHVSEEVEPAKASEERPRYVSERGEEEVIEIRKKVIGCEQAKRSECD